MTTRPEPVIPAEELLRRVTALRNEVAAEGRAIYAKWLPSIERTSFRVSALNFAHYLALRHRDLRDLQVQLMPYGLSSLGRLEARVLANLDAVKFALEAIVGDRPPRYPRPAAFFAGERLLEKHTAALLGPAQRPQRAVRIMVTLGAEAAGDPEIVAALIRAGADAFRINCAHDTPEEWAAMAGNVRTARGAQGRRVPIVMDLAGPKCRISRVSRGATERLERGDRFVVAARDGKADHFTRVICSLPTAVESLRVGDPVFVDDGKLGGVVERIGIDGAQVRVLQAPADGAKLKLDQGLNFPGTELHLPALTDGDRRDLETVAGQAEIIGYSFVQSDRDIALLQDALRDLRPRDWHELGVIAKVETPLAVRNLPEIIVRAASRQPFGVMIARGDLAVELGFERLAEMQEEILWLCEAAHIPVIWATQVLESLIKRGLPTRGDMTDAAMSARAECVMLNKGPQVLEAVALLDRLLSRMAENLTKKTSRLRALRSW